MSILSDIKERRRRRKARRDKIALIIFFVMTALLIFGPVYLSRKIFGSPDLYIVEPTATQIESESQTKTSEKQTENTIEPEAPVEKHMYQIKDQVLFGKYDDNDVIWTVCNKNEDGSILTLVTTYILTGKPYNDTGEYVSWADCSLRKWLLEDFAENVFTEEEKQGIINTVYSIGETEYSDIVTIPKYEDLWNISNRAHATYKAFVEGVPVCRERKIDHPVRTQTNYFSYNSDNSRHRRFMWPNTYGSYWLRPDKESQDKIYRINGWGNYYSDSFETCYLASGIRPMITVYADSVTLTDDARPPYV